MTAPGDYAHEPPVPPRGHPDHDPSVRVPKPLTVPEWAFHPGSPPDGVEVNARGPYEPMLTIYASDAAKAAARLREIADGSAGLDVAELADIADLLTSGELGSPGTSYWRTGLARMDGEIA